MLATGGSANDAIALLKKRGCKHIKFLAIIGAPEGVEKSTPNIPTLKSTFPRLTVNSTRTATFCLGWGMPATVSSAQNKSLK